MFSPYQPRLLSFDGVTAEDAERFGSITGAARTFGRRKYIRHEGSANPDVYRLRSGWLACSVNTPDGGRQITKLHLPGDFVGMPSLASREAFESIEALTDVEVEIISLETFADVFHRQPRLAGLLFLWAQEERVNLMRQLKSVGQMRASKRLAGLILLLHRRLFLGQAAELSFEVPLTQKDLGDATGMSVVHANRGLRELRERGMVTIQGRRVTIHDLPALTVYADLPVDRKRRTDWL